MDLNRKEFSILAALAETDEALPQRALSSRTGYSLGSVNQLVRNLTARGLMQDSRITPKGILALQPYRAKRAVFIAAGFGSRLVPVTLDMPKPLVPVHGKRLIDGLIDAVLAAGIEDIIIVRGYMAEKFDVLKEKYPMIRFVDNPGYAEANNILSALCVKNELQNSYIFDADLLIRNPAVITRYHYTSDFLGVYKERTDDWCFPVKNGIIQDEKRGGLDCYQVIGISYWNAEDGARMAEDLQTVAEMPGGREYYWEQVPMSVLKDRYRVAIRPCSEDDIQEIDTFAELKAIDPSYENYQEGRA